MVGTVSFHSIFINFLFLLLVPSKKRTILEKEFAYKSRQDSQLMVNFAADICKGYKLLSN